MRCMQQAMATVDGDIDYINAHGTSTPAGDIQELKAVREVFGDSTPAIASTKSLSGHSLGAAGVQEAIYSLLMMENDFIAASANVESLDEGADGMDVVQERGLMSPQPCHVQQFWLWWYQRHAGIPALRGLKAPHGDERRRIALTTISQ